MDKIISYDIMALWVNIPEMIKYQEELDVF